MKPLVMFACAAIATPALAQDGQNTALHGTAEARAHLQKHHGGQTLTYVEAERLEFRTNKGDPVFLWDGQGWYGGDRNKLWLKTEGEYDFDAEEFEDAEVQALWSRPVGGFFDLQAGIRHDFAPGGDRTFAVIGAQGLTPYLFEVDTAVFVSDDGDVSARIEAEYELLLSQRLIFQPRTELNFEFQDVAEYDLASGLSTVEAGARLRYEIRRQFAPYIGVSWERAVGQTADFVRANADERGSASFVVGLRGWF